MKIFLVGFMGSGKTAYGKQLAQVMDLDFYDLDQVIADNMEMSIKAIFQGQGEAYFRTVEQQALRATGDVDQAVIATGGGTPAFHDNMDWMRANGETIYLKLLEDKLLKRLKKDQDKRPLIQGMKENQLREYISKQLKARSYYYLQAGRVIDPLEVAPKQLRTILGQ